MSRALGFPRYSAVLLVALLQLAEPGKAQRLPQRLGEVNAGEKLQLDLLNGSRVWGRLTSLRNDTLFLHGGQVRWRNAGGRSAYESFQYRAVGVDAVQGAWVNEGNHAGAAATLGAFVGGFALMVATGIFLGNQDVDRCGGCILLSGVAGAGIGALLGGAIGAATDRWRKIY